MLAVRDQENLASSRQHGAAKKQQQGQASRQLGPKTPGAKFSKTPMKIPLNDENGANGMTSKVLKGGEKSTFVTPMTHRARAVLGDKTTNAKAKGLQTVNGKSTVGGAEQSQVKPQNTVRPKQREPQVETQKLQVHAEESDPASEDEVEYCPPKLEHRPYESDIFPDRILSFDALKPNNMMKGYYRYYFNPLDERGATKHDRELRAETQKTMEECERKIKQDLDELEWTVKAELEPDITTVAKKAPAATRLPVPRNPLSTMRSRNAADVLSMDDTTNSLQRKMAKTSGIRKPLHHKSSSFVMPTLRMNRPATSLATTSIPKKSSAELDATSRTTLGYNKGRAAAASLLTKAKASANDDKNTSASTSTLALGTALPRSHTTLSDYADKTVTPAWYANKQALAADEEDDEVWRERVPFLSIFNPDHITDGGEDGEDEDEEHDPFGIQNKAPAFHDSDDDLEFELKLAG